MLFIQIESLVFIIFRNNIFFSNILNINKFSTKLTINYLPSSNNLIGIWLFLFIILCKSPCLKSVSIINVILFIIIFKILLNYFNFVHRGAFSIQICFSFLLSYIFLITIISSFLEYFIVLEIYSTLYFFFFSYQEFSETNTLIKYKTNLSILLWNNFLTNIFIFLFLFFLTSKYNTTLFSELILLDSCSSLTYIFILGFCFKLGLPAFHFFKYTIYSYLTYEYIFLFPILTTIINLNLLLVLYTIPFIVNLSISTLYVVIPLICLVCLILTNLRAKLLTSYLAVSSISTVSILFILNSIS